MDFVAAKLSPGLERARVKSAVAVIVKFSLSRIIHLASVDVKQHVYLLRAEQS